MTQALEATIRGDEGARQHGQAALEAYTQAIELIQQDEQLNQALQELQELLSRARLQAEAVQHIEDEEYVRALTRLQTLREREDSHSIIHELLGNVIDVCNSCIRSNAVSTRSTRPSDVSIFRLAPSTQTLPTNTHIRQL